MIKKIVVGSALVWHLIASAAIEDRDEFKCLAQAIYREARGEPNEGKIAVAQVIINRTKTPGYPTTICGVLQQPGQFQWTKKYRVTLPDYESYIVARNVILGQHKFAKFKGTHFHARHVQPKWKYKRIALIGNHIFYHETPKSVQQSHLAASV